MTTVTLVAGADLAGPARYGAGRLVRALEARGWRVRRRETLPAAGETGETGETEVALVAAIWPAASAEVRVLVWGVAGTPTGEGLPAEAEALAFRTVPAVAGRPPVVLVLGGDARGLMYGLLEAARRVELAEAGPADGRAGPQGQAAVQALLALFPPETNRPERRLRSLTVFPHHAALEAEWYRSLDFWAWYFDLLALHRFNRFTLTYGHQTAYLAPPYPHFVPVPEHPEVTVPGLTPEGRDENLALLRGVARLATERGIDFTLGVWSQHAYTFGESMVSGLEKENLASFCGHGMRRLVEAVPDIAAVQLRVNSESGIHLDEGARFWRAIFDGVAGRGRRVTLDLRAKAITDDTIEAGLATGLPVVVNTKFWTEHQGLPYHATLLQEGDRYVKRHSYGDQLRYPGGEQRPFEYLFQLWNLGTNRVLLWSDPDWVRRFAAASTLGGAVGFEVCAPLSHKGFGQRGGVWRNFKDRSYDWYRWEQERYWYWYVLFGRLGYAGDADPAVWRREWAARAGEAAAPLVERALGTASGVLPLLTARHSPSASVFGYWPEKDMGGLLDLYQEVPGSDVGMFASAQEAVGEALRGTPGARETPTQSAQRLDELAAGADAALEAALRSACPPTGAEESELRGVALDVRIQAQLARYHAAKGRAAEHLAWFYASGDLDSLLCAKEPARQALRAWEALVALTDGVYEDDLIFGRADDQDGHWKDNLVYARHDVARLDEVEALARRYGLFDVAFDFGGQPANRTGTPPLPYLHTYATERRFTAVGPQTLYSPERGYGWGGTYGLVACEAPKVDGKTLRASGPRPARLPREPLYCDHIRRHPAAPYDNATFLVDLPDGEYEATAILADRSDEPADHGPMVVRLQGRHESPPLRIPAGEVVDWRQRVRVTAGRLDVEVVAPAQADWIVTGLVLRRVAPRWGHRPPACARPGETLAVRATVTSPEPLATTTVRYRFGGDGAFDSAALYAVEDEAAGGEKGRSGAQAVRLRGEIQVPGDATLVEYYLEATDAAGTTACWPVEGAAAPRRLFAGFADGAPRIEHEPVRGAVPGQPVEVRVRISAGAPLSRVTLLYRNVNQMQTHDRLRMRRVDAGAQPEGGERSGGAGEEEYAATIPGGHVSVEWDLMYHVEAVDVVGNAAFCPGLAADVPYVIVPVQR